MITRDSLIIHGPPTAKEKVTGNSLYLISINTVGPYLTPVLQDVVQLKLLSGDVTVALENNEKAIVLSSKVPTYTLNQSYTGALYIAVSGTGFGQILVTTDHSIVPALSKGAPHNRPASLLPTTPLPGGTGTQEPEEDGI